MEILEKDSEFCSLPTNMMADDTGTVTDDRSGIYVYIIFPFVPQNSALNMLGIALC